MSPISTEQALNLQACNAYVRFLDDNGHDDEADDPSTWDLRVFGKWRRRNCMTYLTSLSSVSTTTTGAPFVATPAVPAPTVPAGIPTTATPAPTTAATTTTNLPPVAY